MAPILGIYASQISGHLWAPSGAYDSIATATVGAGGSSSIDFNSIPSTYKHLQIRFLIKSGSANNDFSIGANGSFAISNSSSHTLTGNGSSASAGSWTTQNYVSLVNSPNQVSAFPSGSIGAGIIDILDYADTSKTKVIRTLWGSDQNGAGFINLNSGMLNTTSAITSFNLFNGYNWAQYSQFALYGIKGN
jgi:hypothetical protein